MAAIQMADESLDPPAPSGLTIIPRMQLGCQVDCRLANYHLGYTFHRY